MGDTPSLPTAAENTMSIRGVLDPLKTSGTAAITRSHLFILAGRPCFVALFETQTAREALQRCCKFAMIIIRRDFATLHPQRPMSAMSQSVDTGPPLGQAPHFLVN